MKRLLHVALWLAALSTTPVFAEGPGLGQVNGDAPIGSQAFCLFLLPGDASAQRWLNLAIVQYVEVRPDMVVINYGGGNFGSGYEVKIPVKSSEEANAQLARLRQTAESCKRQPRNAP
ncbi:hypothetical protein [Niveibacterium sp. SC-1]|uniref:hypothetical protein n=1 Tax=Niveibacterium sp. SC-1 TaxID=3135646 RepID=UPI00311FC69F